MVELIIGGGIVGAIHIETEAAVRADEEDRDLYRHHNV